MRALTAAELLAVWERGLSQPSLRRALVLLCAACPESSPEALAQISIGERDEKLLTLREWIFGSRIEGFTTCPSCGDQLEMAFETADLRQTSPSATTDGTFGLEVENHSVTFRLPNTLDLLEISTIPAADSSALSAEAALLRRCVRSARAGTTEISPERLPEAVVSGVAARMAEIDPQADVQLALSCPACQHAWSEAFDIVTFFWREIETWAGRILRDVHTLASAYGWSEAEILGLSPHRRRMYLEMIAG